MAADVIVEFGAKIDQLLNATEQVKSKIHEVGSSTESMKGSFEGVSSIIAEAFTVAAIAEFIHKMMELGLQTSNMSILLGVSTETVAGLDFAAQAAGTSLDAMALSGERLLLNIQKTQRDALSPAALALHNLGLSAKDFQGLALPEAFALLADHAAMFDNTTGNVTQALQLLIGRSQALIPLLLQGGDAFRENVEKGSELAGMTAQQTEDLKELHEQWLMLKTTLLGWATTVMGPVVQILKDTKQEVDGIAAALRSMRDGAQTAMDGLMGVETSAAKTQVTISKFLFAKEELQSFIDTAKLGSLPFDQINMAAKQALEAALKAQDGIIKMASLTMQQQSAIYEKDFVNLQKSQVQKVQAVGAAEQAMYAAQIQAENQKLANYGLTATQRQEIIDKIKEYQIQANTAEVKNSVDAEKLKIAAAESALTDITSAWDSQMKGLLFQHKSWAEAMTAIWQDLTIKILQELEKILIKKLAVAAIGVGVDVATGGASASVGGIGGALGGLLHFAEGTPYVPQTQLAVVHQGEMVIPPNMADAIRGGQIGLNGGGGDGGSGNNLSISINALDAQSVQTWLRTGGAAMISRYLDQNPNARMRY